MIKLKENKQELDSCILSTFLKLSTVTLQLAAGSWRVVTCCLKFIGFINCTKYFSKAKHCDFAAGSWQLACCYLLSQIYWLHQLHQTSKFASSNKMYIFWYRLIGLLQATYTAHETKYWLDSCWNRVLGSSLSLRIIVKASCRCSTCLKLQTNLNSLSPHTIKTINL